MTATIETIKQLRALTGVSINGCKEALEAGNGDMKEAFKILRARGLKKLGEGAATTEGVIEVYRHHNGQVAVLVEVATQTDFAARRPEVRDFARDLAMQVASANPLYVTPEDIPEDVKDAEIEVIRKRYESAKTEIFVSRILPGAIKSFYAETCLLEQDFVKDPKKKVKDLLAELVSKLDEVVSVKRFVRFKVGE